ncbi:MAG: PAS domain S-box protein [Gemmatirosa sp.]
MHDVARERISRDDGEHRLAVAGRIALPLDALTDAVVVLDREWRYVYVNARAGELFGREPASLIGRHIWTEFPEGVEQPFHQAYERAMRTRTEVCFESEYALWGRSFENRVFPIDDGLLILFTETTAVRRAREELERSEQRFRALVTATAATAWWTDATGAIVESVPRWQEFTGQSAEQARGWGWLDAVHPDDRAATAEAWAGAVARRADYAIEHRIRRHDGEWRRMLVRALPLFGADGELREWVGAQIDVTDERAAREALAAGEARFRSLSVSSPLGIYETDMEGRVNYANPRAEQIFGMAAAEAMGSGWQSRVHPDDLAPMLERWHVALAAGDDYVYEYRLRLSDGTTRYVRKRSAALRDAQGRLCGSVGTIEDITEHHELDARLRQAQKMEAVGQLAGGIAHDFNNLLTVINGNLELATHEIPEDHAARGDLAEVTTAVRRAHALVRQLLTFSRKQVLSLRALDLNEFVRGAEKLLRRVIGEEIVLQVQLSGEPVIVQADANQLEQVLINLAINARDAMRTARHGYMGGRGTLTIEVDVCTLAPSHAARWGATPTGRYARLLVRDTGHGMDEGTMSHAFEPFFTTKPVGEGTGLGLATVYAIVTQGGGAVRIDSTPGQGTQVQILLPHVGADGHASPAARAPRQEEPGARETILLVEDERAVRTAARRLLERRGYTVLEAQHGVDALLVWREQRDAIGVLVTDIRMPEMGGLELVSILRGEAPTLPVVYMSGYAEHQGTTPLREREAFVEKPFTGDALAQAVARVLGAPH